MHDSFERGKMICRAKRLYDGQWICGFYVYVVTDKKKAMHLIYSGYAEDDCGDIYPDWFEVDPDTVCRSTGLLDDNGAWIFENDIIRLDDRILKVWWNGEAFQWQAKTRENPFYTYEIGMYEYDNIDFGWIAAPIDTTYEQPVVKVIGNTFDNPDLWVVEFEEANKSFEF